MTVFCVLCVLYMYNTQCLSVSGILLGGVRANKTKWHLIAKNPLSDHSCSFHTKTYMHRASSWHDLG